MDSSKRITRVVRMADDAIGDTTIALEVVDSGDPEVESDNIYSYEAVMPNGEGIREAGIVREILTRVELYLAYSSEKLVNLDILLMHVATMESDLEAFSLESDEILAFPLEKALEFDFLSGILDSEVRDLDSFMDSLQMEIRDACQRIISYEPSGESFVEMEAKLHDAEESLKQSKDQVAEMRAQAAMFHRTLLAFGGQENYFSEGGQVSNMNAKLKMQTAEQQRHILRMLENSLARELDLEKKLTDSRQNEEEIRIKLHSTEQELLCMEEAEEILFWRIFEVENAAEVLRGISKELMGQLQVSQFNLNSLIQRESEARSKLQDCTEQLNTKENALRKLETSNVELDNFLLTETNRLKDHLKEAEDRYIVANSEAFTLREKVSLLEEQLKESETQLQNAKATVEANKVQHDALYSELNDMENAIEDLKENLSRAENKAESAETKCKLLTETNLELNEELGFLKNDSNNIEKINLLEKQLRESDVQLQNAKVSAEATQEQLNMLYTAIGDMENLINDLKLKVSKAESRAETVEDNCIVLSETNFVLNEELSFLRSRLECLESSLHQADNTKIETAKDISIRTKVITDLVMQLAVERERLQNQVTSLMKENRTLAEKLQNGDKDMPAVMTHNGNKCTTSTNAPHEEDTESSATSLQLALMSKESYNDAEKSSGSTSNHKRRKTSIVWEHFDLFYDKNGIEIAKCKNCDKTYNAEVNVGTPNMLHYIEICGEGLDESSKSRVSKCDQDAYREHEHMAMAIIRHVYTFSFAEHESNRCIHSGLNPKVKHISCNTTKADVLKMYNKEKKKL
ncbi:PREDICTED: WPP domain-interacting tail-anchored protein 1-like isoform X2 [Nelumbo nucifera]|uniref:WPP domain-interacting tail-anchored protein 1-like isoform X2 n=1 Tax=Nelumbo nucifera TaxID=4432 RepID=A0A1U8PZP4_NELNU|nr:PREDICTED: WPP domain-interacting tail-anchored protein 1-like isoform X2 [Nelumbo nucifera]